MPLLFRKNQRIVRRDDFTQAIRRGVCAADDTIVLFAMATGPGHSARLGVTIPKKVGNAVVRNRWKRLIRESFRTQQSDIPSGFDYVIRPKKGAVADWPAIQRAVPKLARRATNEKNKR